MNMDLAALREAIVDEVNLQLLASKKEEIVNEVALQLKPFREFIEKARLEDNHRWRNLETQTSQLTQERTEALLRKKIAEENAEENEQKQDKRFSRLKLLVEILGVIAGSGLLNWLLHHHF